MTFPIVRSHQLFSKLLASSSRVKAMRELIFVLLAGEIFAVDAIKPSLFRSKGALPDARGDEWRGSSSGRRMVYRVRML